MRRRRRLRDSWEKEEEEEERGGEEAQRSTKSYGTAKDPDHHKKTEAGVTGPRPQFWLYRCKLLFLSIGDAGDAPFKSDMGWM